MAEIANVCPSSATALPNPETAVVTEVGGRILVTSPQTRPVASASKTQAAPGLSTLGSEVAPTTNVRLCRARLRPKTPGQIVGRELATNCPNKRNALALKRCRTVAHDATIRSPLWCAAVRLRVATPLLLASLARFAKLVVPTAATIRQSRRAAATTETSRWL